MISKTPKPKIISVYTPVHASVCGCMHMCMCKQVCVYVHIYLYLWSLVSVGITFQDCAPCLETGLLTRNQAGLAELWGCSLGPGQAGLAEL